MNLQSEITAIKGVGEKSAALFHKMHIENVGDLLFHYPRTYETFLPPVSIASLKAGENVTIQGIVSSQPQSKSMRRLKILTVMVNDCSGQIQLTFFNMPFLKNVLYPGKEFIFHGFVREGRNHALVMEQPRIYKEEEYCSLLRAIQPRYSLTKGLTNQAVSKAVKQILTNCPLPEETLPGELLEEEAFMGYADALRTIHFPENEEKLAKAKRRLIFQEFFYFILQLRQSKQLTEHHPNLHPMVETAECVRFLEALPYRLTKGQQTVMQEIRADMTGKEIMSRLIQGDVGSGKTIVAIWALLFCVTNGYQGAMMAPTEVLARQHFETIRELTQKYGLPFKPVLLTGSMTAKDKREAYEELEDGRANLALGTHALIQDKVKFRNLALVVTDEQHRFGVRQRENFKEKGSQPHVLVMSATPIPRSLAIIMYGDLHLSVIKEMPGGRKPIKNCVVGPSYRPTAYSFIAREVCAGRQAYCICPMVEEGDADGLENVEEYTEKMKASLPSAIRISFLHGKMRPSDKNRIMEDFAAGNIDVLVSTTVIEVGINVPNATVMMVENAERFGLAQLHQLRGRVGRGEYQSYCIFINTGENEETRKRLDILNRSNDGFFIAEEDLRLRGPGDLFGVRQSGNLEFRLGCIYQDADLLKLAADAAEKYGEKALPDTALGQRNAVDFSTI